MARPREFDEEAVLNAAVLAFWEFGYEATSMRDLAEKTGLTTASLYNAFGDKRAFYRRALDHYVSMSFGDRVGRFEHHLPPRDALLAFFNEIVDRSLSDPNTKGCMLVNSALELAPHDPEFQRAIAAVLVQVEQFFRRCAEAGQRDGSIPSHQSPVDIARLLLCVLLGVRVLARARPERELLEGLIRPVSALLGKDIPAAANESKARLDGNAALL